MKKNELPIVLIIVISCLVALLVLPLSMGEEETTAPPVVQTPQQNVVQIPQQNVVQTPVQTTAVSDQQQTTAQQYTPAPAPAPEQETTAAPADAKPQTTQEIIDKYTMLVDKYKQEKPAYKRKEFQSLPEEYQNFGDGVNLILGLVSGYMVSEEDAEVLERPAGSADIINDMPVHGTEKGCTLTDYDAVSWAKCDDLGDGTYKISFSLKEEYNAEPTPADTLIPPSAHGAVMQPIPFKDIKAEIDKVASKIPGIDLNRLDLIYRDCDFSCVYDPKTDEVLSITHYIVIDIEADVTLFKKPYSGSARLINEMYIYDITW